MNVCNPLKRFDGKVKSIVHSLRFFQPFLGGDNSRQTIERRVNFDKVKEPGIGLKL